MRRHSFILTVIFFLAVAMRAQVTPSVIIDKINSKDLTNPFVSALFQDQKGYLWVGTLGGLNKYNGYGFSRYRHVPGDTNTLSYSAITCLNQADPDKIFIGTRRGLNIYDYNTDKFQRILFTDKSNKWQRKNNIQCILANKAGDIMVGTQDGLFTLNESLKQLTPISTKNGNLLEGWSVLAICNDRLGNIWMSARKMDTVSGVNRVFRYNFSTGYLLEITIDQGYSEHCGISEDYLGNIWVAADNGLVMINPGNNKQKFYRAPNGFYSNISYSHTRDNTIWQCYWSFGLTAFDIDKKTFRVYKNDPGNPKSLVSNKCWALFKDDNDIMWIGTDVGLQKITSKRPAVEVIRKKHFDEKYSFKGNIITTVHASRKHNDIIFAGVEGEGFAVYDRREKKSINFGPNAENRSDERFVNQFVEDASGDVYVMGQNNFHKISFSNTSPLSKSFFTYQEHYCASGVDDPMKPDILWVGCRGEIFCFDKKTQQATFFDRPLGIQNVFYSSFVCDNHIYFGHRNGLLKLNPATLKFENIDLPDVGNIQNAIVVNDNEVFLSSQFLGLIRFFPRGKKYEVIYRSKNDYYAEPAGMLLYKNKLWLTGVGGISCVDPNSGEFSEVTTDDGLPTDIVHKADLMDGYFYLGTQEGLAIINPDFQVSHFNIPKIDVTEFRVLTDNSSFMNLSSGSEITLNENQNSFRINFTVLDFNLPQKNKFKFRLAPIQEEWATPIGENFLIFNALPAGNYKFELMGANADQIWTTEPFVINFKIIPPFYKTRWFYLLCVACLVIGSFTFMYLRVRSDNRKKIMLEKIIRERTAEIQMQRAELLDSISYARRIQKAIFVGGKMLNDTIPQSFIFYKPKDQVSGDFYWIGKYKDLLIIFAGDCTGHGVPGAMLSIVGTSLLNQIVHEENIYLPGEILTRLNYLFYKQLSLEAEHVRDGMDASVITVNVVNHTAYFSGAKLDGVCVANNILTELKAQRISIGERAHTEYKTQALEFSDNRFFYLFSDGIKDQHGGPDKKKLSARRFKDILHQASALPFEHQKQFIYETVTSWKAELPQTDDMILIGFKF